MFRIFIPFFLVGFMVLFGSGCQKKGVVRPQGVQPFVPVHVEFKGLRKDVSVEKEIAQRLFCTDCLFIRADTPPQPYTLIVHYDRRMDLKSLGLVVLSAALNS